MNDLQQKINYIKENGVIFDKWLNNPTQYSYMIEHTYNMLKLIIKNNFTINKPTINLNFKMAQKTTSDGECIYFSKYVHDIEYGGYSVKYEYQIYIDKTETVYCSDGFAICYTDKKYYNKQFINMILQKEFNYKNKIK